QNVEWLLLAAPPEPRHHAAEPAADLMARISGDLAHRVVGLDDPQLLVRGAARTSARDSLGGLRSVARTAGLGGLDLRLQAGDVIVGIWCGSGWIGVVGHGTHCGIYLHASGASAALPG